MNVRPGVEAPEFSLQGYYEGGVKEFKLSDFRGKWVVICFYPADFTFV
ncbi:AhpC/TSA family protein [Desulfonauticus submarinus]|nr:AhpC/TSA family protein [Desulfonauticus submarinus]